MSPDRAKRPGDMLARMRGTVAAGSSSAEPAEAPPARRRRPPTSPEPPARRTSSPTPEPTPRPRRQRREPDPEPTASLDGFEVRSRGGKRTVLYLPADVLAHLEAIREAAAAQGGRLDRSAIVSQLVRRHRDGR